MRFPLDNFWQFCNDLHLETKEYGIIKLGTQLLGSQQYFVEEVVKGLEEDVHQFIVLKGRQLGISTICLALDLFWHNKFSGVQGTLATDNEQNRDMFRSTLAMYLDGLDPKWHYPVLTHNRHQLVFKNRSRMLYQVAGTRRGKGGGMGRGKAIMFMHATEVSSWVDQEGLASLKASLAQHNPRRLYVYESTARGYNMFHEMWDIAKRSKTQKAIFIGWWRNHLYRVAKGTQIYNVYWDGKLSAEEKQWARRIDQQYGIKLDDEQIAWWRWQMAEEIQDEMLMHQEYPMTEEDAFILSGSQFFNTVTINDRYKLAKSRGFDSYRIVMGDNFSDTELIDSLPNIATLKIWDIPKKDAYYVIGADPAYGSSDWADRFAIQVFRCFADGMDQVAEFCTADCNTFQFAWVIAYLCGAYGPNVIYNLEINGPGQAVFTEMQNLRRLSGVEAGKSDFKRGLYDVLAQQRAYVYRRIDSVMGASPAWHTKTTYDVKERMLNHMKDCFERGILKIYSADCLEEMKNVTRDEGTIGAPGRGKDDRVIACSLAAIAWADQLRMRLAQANVTREKSYEQDESGDVQHPAARVVQNYLKNIGVGQG